MCAMNTVDSVDRKITIDRKSTDDRKTIDRSSSDSSARKESTTQYMSVNVYNELPGSDEVNNDEEVDERTCRFMCGRVFFVLNYMVRSLVSYLLFFVFFCVGGIINTFTAIHIVELGLMCAYRIWFVLYQQCWTYSSIIK